MKLPDAKQSLTIVMVVLLILFGVIEAEAILAKDTINQIFSGLGILGSIIMLWLRSME